jgi:hypothetical protein
MLQIKYILPLLLLTAGCAGQDSGTPSPAPDQAFSAFTISYADDGCTDKEIDITINEEFIATSIEDGWFIELEPGTYDAQISITDSCNPAPVLYHYNFVITTEYRLIELLF